MVEAMNQSRRCHRPTILPASEISAWIASQTPGEYFVADVPSELTNQSSRQLRLEHLITMRSVLVGPEGGFSDEERIRLADVPRLVLGSSVLRTETACVSVIAAIVAARGTGVTPG